MTDQLMEEDVFQNALDEDPNDHTTRLVFADWLMERDDPRGLGYRAIGLCRIRPWDLAGWSWFNVNRRGKYVESMWVGVIRWYNYGEIPGLWFKELRNYSYNTVPPEHAGRRYPHRDDAENELALAFFRLTPEQKNWILEEAQK